MLTSLLLYVLGLYAVRGLLDLLGADPTWRIWLVAALWPAVAIASVVVQLAQAIRAALTPSPEKQP